MKINQGPSEDLPCLRSFNDLRKIFEIKDHSRIFGNSSGSSFIRRSSDDLRDQRSFKELTTIFMIEDQSSILKIFEVKDNLEIFENSSRSNIVGGYLDNRDRRPFNDLLKIFDIKDLSRISGRSSRSKVIQESSKNLPDHISFEDNR